MLLNLLRSPTPPATEPVAATRAAIAAAIEASPKSRAQVALEQLHAEHMAVVAAAEADSRKIIAQHRAAANSDFSRSAVQAVNAAEAALTAAQRSASLVKIELKPERQARAARFGTAIADHVGQMAAELVQLLDHAAALRESMNLVAHAHLQLGGEFKQVPHLYADELRRFAKRMAR